MADKLRKRLEAACAAAIKIIDHQAIFIQNFKVIDDETYEQLVSRKERILEVWQNYKTDSKELADNFPDTEQDFAFEDRYFTLISKVNALLRKSSAICETAPVTDSRYSQEMPFSVVRLPELPSPQFSGRDEDWQSFKDLFTALIIQNKNATEMEKMQYLVQALPSECRPIVSQFPNEPNSFVLAWNALNSRYQNPRLLATAHITALECPPVLDSTNPHTWRQFVDHYQTHVSALDNIDLQVPLSELLILHRILAHCPHAVVQEWERNAPLDKNPQLKDFYNFCERQYKIAAINNAGTSAQNSKPPRELKQSVPRTWHGPSNNATNNTGNKCSFCTSVHLLHQCQKFRELSQNARFSHVREQRLCHNCLKKYSKAHNCSAFTCRQCNANHHTLLHGYFESKVNVAVCRAQSPAPGNYAPFPPPCGQQRPPAVLEGGKLSPGSVSQPPGYRTCMQSAPGGHSQEFWNSSPASGNYAPFTAPCGQQRPPAVLEGRNFSPGIVSRPPSYSTGTQNAPDCHSQEGRTSRGAQNSVANSPGRAVESNSNSSDAVQSQQSARANSFKANVNLYSSHLTPCLLPTAEILVSDRCGNLHACTALVDSGSNCNLVSEALIKRLDIASTAGSVEIKTVGSGTTSSQHIASLMIASRMTKWHCQEEFIVMPAITTDLPPVTFACGEWNVPPNLPLADPLFNVSKSIDILLGAAIAAEIILTGKISLSKGMPILQNTELGWVVSGNMPLTTANAHGGVVISNFTYSMEKISQQLQKFWQLEEVPTNVPLSPEEQFCEKVYTGEYVRAVHRLCPLPLEN